MSSQTQMIQLANGELALVVYCPVTGERIEVPPEFVEHEFGLLLGAAGNGSLEAEGEPSSSSPNLAFPPSSSPSAPAVASSSSGGSAPSKTSEKGLKDSKKTWPRNPIACLRCRNEKKKCDGCDFEGRCDRCSKAGTACIYEPVKANSTQVGPGGSQGLVERRRNRRHAPFPSTRPAARNTDTSSNRPFVRPTPIPMAPLVSSDPAIRALEAANWHFMVDVLSGKLELD